MRKPSDSDRSVDNQAYFGRLSGDSAAPPIAEINEIFVVNGRIELENGIRYRVPFNLRGLTTPQYLNIRTPSDEAWLLNFTIETDEVKRTYEYSRKKALRAPKRTPKTVPKPLAVMIRVLEGVKATSFVCTNDPAAIKEVQSALPVACEYAMMDLKSRDDYMIRFDLVHPAQGTGRGEVIIFARSLTED